MQIFCGILAAGSGERYSKKLGPKQLLPLGGSALFAVTLKAVRDSEIFDSIIVSIIEKLDTEFKQSIEEDLGYKNDQIIQTTPGGDTRMESILNIIEKFKSLYVIGNEDILCLVDANRPLVNKDLFLKVIAEAKKHYVSCPAKPLVDGVGFVDNGFLSKIPQKSKIQSIQTPEACNFQMLINLINKGKHIDNLGISEIFLSSGIQPKIVESDFRTYKVTHPKDMEIVEILMSQD